MRRSSSKALILFGKGSREGRFAAVKAALRKQSLTFEPYSQEVIYGLWKVVEDCHKAGDRKMLRKALQKILLEYLALPLATGRMSKNKVNKVFQVLIRSCFVLHPRGDGGGHPTPLKVSPVGDGLPQTQTAEEMDPAQSLSSLQELSLAERQRGGGTPQEMVFARTGLLFQDSPQAVGSGRFPFPEGMGEGFRSDDAQNTVSWPPASPSNMSPVWPADSNPEAQSRPQDVGKQHDVEHITVSVDEFSLDAQLRAWDNQSAQDPEEGEDMFDLEGAGAICELLEEVDSYEKMVASHNAFIKRVAIDANIRMSPQEWEDFFASGRGAARQAFTAEQDVLGYMQSDEAAAFRTQWCTKEHPHDSECCEYAHVEQNQGWLRRDPREFSYRPRKCPHINFYSGEARPNTDCPKGRQCDEAHSFEEINWHPDNYKTRKCHYGLRCTLKHFCSFAHMPAVSSGPPSQDGSESNFSAFNGSNMSDHDGDREGEWQARYKLAAGNMAIAQDRAKASLEARGRGNRRPSGPQALLAALRKRSADMIQPPKDHETLLREIYATLRKKEPNGLDEKDLINCVYYDRQSRSRMHSPGEEVATISKTKVRGVVSVLKFGNVLRPSKTEATSQHMLHIMRELPNFEMFLDRHNAYLFNFARELQLEMTPEDWDQLTRPANVTASPPPHQPVMRAGVYPPPLPHPAVLPPAGRHPGEPPPSRHPGEPPPAVMHTWDGGRRVYSASPTLERAHHGHGLGHMLVAHPEDPYAPPGQLYLPSPGSPPPGYVYHAVPLGGHPHPHPELRVPYTTVVTHRLEPSYLPHPSHFSSAGPQQVVYETRHVSYQPLPPPAAHHVVHTQPVAYQERPPGGAHARYPTVLPLTVDRAHGPVMTGQPPPGYESRHTRRYSAPPTRYPSLPVYNSRHSDTSSTRESMSRNGREFPQPSDIALSRPPSASGTSLATSPQAHQLQIPAMQGGGAGTFSTAGHSLPGLHNWMPRLHSEREDQAASRPPPPRQTPDEQSPEDFPTFSLWS